MSKATPKKNAPTKVEFEKLIDPAYRGFWVTKKRYRVLKGGRSSGKSTTAAFWFVINMMLHPQANVLAVRQTANTHESSTFAEIQQAASTLGVYHLWKFTTNPCEAEYKPTGQKILFRGFDDPLKLTSIKVPRGVLCWVWFNLFGPHKTPLIAGTP